ncbi:MAG: reverse transcriptase family protein, partial [Bacteroidota bacterium]
LQSTSHHQIVLVETCLNVNTVSYEDERTEPRTGFDTLNFFADEIDWDNIKEQLQDVKWKESLSEDPNEIVKTINSLRFNICKDNIPNRTQNEGKRRSKFQRYRRTLTKKRRKITKKLLHSNSQNRKAKIKEELLQIEKQLQKSFKDSKQFAENKAIESIKKNSKYFFAYARKKAKVKTKIGPLIDNNGKFTMKNKEMADILSKQYSKVFSQPMSPDAQTFDPGETKISEMVVTEEDIIKAINELSPSSAAGPDGFPAIFLKHSKEAFPLCHLWKTSLEKGIVPTKMKKSTITPIYKGGNKSLASNYRPVALTSHVIKLFEKVIRSQIVKHMDDNNLFNPNQHGFRSGRSCLSQLLEQHDLILNLLNKETNVDVIYLDFSKAFDKVDHSIVLSKFKRLGITGKIYNWIKSFLRDRQQTVMVNGVKSNQQEVISGVPQGSVLGPLIFLILIGDIDANVINCIVKSFADDTRATKAIKDAEDVKILQQELQILYQWTITNNMKLNDTKFELLRYGSNNEIKKETYYTSPSGDKIEEKDFAKDLGVLMSNDCHFKNQIETTIEKAKNLISWILRTFTCRSSHTMLTLYKSLVIPILEYCSVLWSPGSVGLIQRLEEIQKSFLKQIRGTSQNYWESLMQLKIYSLQRRRERYRIIYTWKILESIVPNINDSFKAKEHPRLGRMCVTKYIGPNNSKLRDSTLAIQGAKLFNAMPKCIRNLKNVPVDKFKTALDKHLKTIPDEPQIRGYTGCRRVDSNSILDMKSLC